MTRTIQVTTTLYLVTTERLVVRDPRLIVVWFRQVNFACTQFQFLP